jgi:hypothetical protein
VAGYSLNIQPEQMLYCPPEADVEDNICSLIINVKSELLLNKVHCYYVCQHSRKLNVIGCSIVQPEICRLKLAHLVISY